MHPRQSAPSPVGAAHDRDAGHDPALASVCLGRAHLPRVRSTRVARPDGSGHVAPRGGFRGGITPG